MSDESNVGLLWREVDRLREGLEKTSERTVIHSAVSREYVTKGEVSGMVETLRGEIRRDTQDMEARLGRKIEDGLKGVHNDITTSIDAAFRAQEAHSKQSRQGLLRYGAIAILAILAAASGEGSLFHVLLKAVGL